MRRLGTALVLAAVLALGIAAAVDALRSGEQAAPAPLSPPQVDRAELVASLRGAGVSGVLTYSDARCRLRAVTLPDLLPHPAPGIRACRVPSRSGRMLRFGRPGADPQRIVVARCRRGVVEVGPLGARPFARFRGCAPAWRPDGTLTAVRDGAVVELASSRVLLSRSGLGGAFSQAGWVRLDYTVEEIAWLDSETLVAVVRAGARGPELLTVLRKGRLAATPLIDDDLSELRTSPGGRNAAARATGRVRLLALDAQGRRMALPRGALGVAWSPDERWTAVATGNGIVLLREGRGRPGVLRLPLAATDLVWR
jgi:hypothetical protein